LVAQPSKVTIIEEGKHPCGANSETGPLWSVFILSAALIKVRQKYLNHVTFQHNYGCDQKVQYM